jgi:hypothetical protein
VKYRDLQGVPVVGFVGCKCETVRNVGTVETIAGVGSVGSVGSVGKSDPERVSGTSASVGKCRKV